MTIEMDKANLLAEAIKGFELFVQKSYRENNTNLSNSEKLYRLKHLVDEFKLNIIAAELSRINRFVYDEKYTMILVNDFKKAITIIGEFIDNNYDDLFIFSARLYTLRSLGSSYS